MKFVIPLCLLLIACNSAPNNKEKAQKQDNEVARFDWLIGSWKRTNEEKGKQTYETWKQDFEHSYSGISYTLSQGDTVFKENIRLANSVEGWYYHVNQKDDSSWTSFELTSISTKGFECVNEQNEFPKKISYARNGDMIYAAISDDSTEIKFDFKKMQ